MRTSIRTRLQQFVRRPAVLIAAVAAMSIGATPAGASIIQSWTYRVAAHDRNVHRFTYRAGEFVRPTVTGDGTTDIDCYLYYWDTTASQWTKVAEDTDDTDVCILRPMYPLAGDYALSVRNRGDVYNDYQLDR